MLFIVNSREDLEALPDEERAKWMDRLARSIWKLDRDDENERWILVQNTSAISRFGFTVADFPNAPKPEIPPYVPTPPEPAPRVTALQGMLALDAAGLSDQYEAWATDPARTFAEKAFIQRAQFWQRDDQTLIAAATALGLDDAQIDALFEAAAQL